MTRPGWGSLVLAAACAGCAGRGPRAEDFVPPEDAAWAALDAALGSWARGEAQMPRPGAGPAVEVADGLRTKGRTLLRYEILGPVPADAPRCFAVRLTLGNPAEERRERYVVLGLDPVWVWRYEDFVMLSHWDHKMAAEKGKASPPTPKR